MDLNKAIRIAVDSGKVVLGSDRSVKMALNGGGAKLVIVSENCPEMVKGDLKHYCKLASIPVVEFEGSSVELGTVCGKPFPVSALSVLEAGNSGILDAVRK